MLLCEYFVFAHMPKTGGLWFKDVVTKHAPADWHVKVLDQAQRHLTNQELLQLFPEYTKKPTLLFVRNPWHYYASLYFFWHNQYWFDRSKDPTIRARADIYIAQPLKAHGPTLSTAGFEGLIDYQAQHNYTQSKALELSEGKGLNFFGRYERLRKDAADLLEALVPVVPRSMLSEFTEAPPTNVSKKHGDPLRFYTPELVEKVARIEESIVKRFGYRIEDSFQTFNR